MIGPALLAFTLMMAAFSLRQWRRNGVACDELLFLPGTLHGVQHGVDSPLVVSAPGNSSNNILTSNNNNNNPSSSPTAQPGESSTPKILTSPPPRHNHSEGDIAAGGPHPDALELRRRSRSMEDSPLVELVSGQQEAPNNNSSKRAISMDEMRQQQHQHNYNQLNGSGHQQQRQHKRVLGDVEMTVKPTHNRAVRAESFDSSLGWGSDEEGDELLKDSEEEDLEGPSHDDSLEEPRRGCLSGQNNLLCRGNSQGDDRNAGASNGSSNQYHGIDMHQFRENHPRITRMGSFFFFRSPTSSTHNAEYAPSGPAVVGAALDLSMPVLFNFHLYIEAFNHIKPKDESSEAPAKILPIIFLSVLIVRSIIPPGRRGRFWSTMKFTVMSPFHRVRFRDAFVGDVITSLVRPGQDILFALSYYVTVLYGTVTGKYGLTESGELLEGSWILHNVILPSCALLPLWWKFLQTLRQAYDEESRWPHLGNAFKYLTATLVILYGMTHPENRRSPWWIVCYGLAVLYQIWWDVVMDWDLLEIPPQDFRSALDAISVENWLTNISSLRPESTILLTLQMRVFTPMAEKWRRMNARIQSLRHIRLRSKRLYKTESFYWKVFAYNACMRFVWMLCFIPAYRLSSSGAEKVTTFSSDVNSYVGVLLPVAEIVRRCFWGLLFLERKTIQMTDDDAQYSRLDSSMDLSFGNGSQDEMLIDGEEDELSGDHSQNGKSTYQMFLPTWLNAQQQIQHDASQSSFSTFASTNERIRALTDSIKVTAAEFREHLFIVELSCWASAFVVLGCWAAS